MSIDIKRVALLGRHDDSHVAELLTALIAHLTKAGVAVLAGTETGQEFGIEGVADDELASGADLMIAIGGDGTMLRAGGLVRDYNTPLLGINRGRLGFLADVPPEEMLASVDHILNGNYSKDSRLLLEASLQRGSSPAIRATAFNDVVIQRSESGRMVDVVTRINDTYVNTHSGDGLIVSTPTGSTAYALSCSGPIIDPRVDAMVVVPICPHTLTDRPLVIPADQMIDISVLVREGTRAEVIVDGHSIGDIEPGDSLSICRSGKRIHLIHPPDYDYFGILRSKLFWGRDSRKRDAE